jgi:hypothetical protein
VKFTQEIFRVLSPHCHIGEEITNQCIKTIELELMEMDNSEKKVQDIFTSEVSKSYFLKYKNHVFFKGLIV